MDTSRRVASADELTVDGGIRLEGAATTEFGKPTALFSTTRLRPTKLTIPRFQEGGSAVSLPV